MRGDRPFTYMATPGSSQQGDQARAYAVVMSELQDVDPRRATEVSHEEFLAKKEAVYATLRQLPTLEVMERKDIEERRKARSA